MLTILDFDNSPSKIASRLLEMYPVETLKAEYDLKGYSADVIEGIIKRSTISDIKEDCLRLMGHCRQHVFVFAHDLKAGSLPNKLLTHGVEFENLAVDLPDRKEIEYLLVSNFHFFQVKGQTAIPHRSINWWPVKIVVTPGYLELRITIAERHTKSSGEFYYRSRDLEEESIVGALFAVIGHKVGLCPADLNRGLKAVWDADVIDSKFVTRKAAKSLDTSLMNTGYTFKKDFPARYKELLADPLRKSVFQVINGDKTLPETFAIDAGEGFVAFRSFNAKGDAIDNLMSTLLKHN